MRKLVGIPLDILHKCINYSLIYSLDLFGEETISNSADFFAAGLNVAARKQKKHDEYITADGVFSIEVMKFDGANHQNGQGFMLYLAFEGRNQS